MITSKETGLHLFQPPFYRVAGEKWFTTYDEAVLNSNKHLTWDPTTILSILSFNYACGDRTLVNEITRSPWLSSVSNETLVLNPIPLHDRVWKPYNQIAKNLEELLLAEALEVCRGRNEIYVLLSGGLDSRVTAGILAKLFHEGRLSCKPIAVTWGLPNSRDVIYGQQTARILGFDWAYINLGPDYVLRNVKATAITLGGLVSPLHLHAMLWFENVSKDALVLASSYGDMVGRAEFAKKHLLELDFLHPVNKFGLLSSKVLLLAKDHLLSDLEELHAHSPNQPKYVLCEHEMHCNYTRGMLGHAMSVINRFCTVYQMFTHPSTYTYMWSIHPALRFDAIYAELINSLEPRLLSIPWARTNRAIKGPTSGADNGLRTNFHDYPAWISGPVYDEFYPTLDLDWFNSTGLFNIEKVKSLCDQIRMKPTDMRYYDVFIWLICLRRFSDWVNNLGYRIELPELASKSETIFVMPEQEISKIRQNLSRVKLLQKTVKNIKRVVLRFLALIRYPPHR